MMQILLPNQMNQIFSRIAQRRIFGEMMKSNGDGNIYFLMKGGFHPVFMSWIIIKKDVCRSKTLSVERFHQINKKVGNVETFSLWFSLKIAFGRKQFNG